MSQHDGVKMVVLEDILGFFEKLLASGPLGDLKILCQKEGDGAHIIISNPEWRGEYNVWPPCDPGDRIMVTVPVVLHSYNYWEPDDYDDQEIGFVDLPRELVQVLTGHFYQEAVEARLFRDPEE